MTAPPRPHAQPLVIGIGGGATPGSTDRALDLAMRGVEAAGCRTARFDGAFLARLPYYVASAPGRSPEQAALIEAVRAASGLIIASPGYHGGVSGLVKNAMDHLEDTARDPRPYLDGMPVGLIATAHGWQAGGTTLAALRTIVHALRGWPTPLGVAANTAVVRFDEHGGCGDPAVARQISLLAHQVAGFALAPPLCQAGA